MSRAGRSLLSHLQAQEAPSGTAGLMPAWTSSHSSPGIAALNPLQLAWMLVLSSTSTFTLTIIFSSVLARIPTVKFARKEESSLSRSRPYGSSSEASSRKAETSC